MRKRRLELCTICLLFITLNNLYSQYEVDYVRNKRQVMFKPPNKCEYTNFKIAQKDTLNVTAQTKSVVFFGGYLNSTNLFINKLDSSFYLSIEYIFPAESMYVLKENPLIFELTDSTTISLKPISNDTSSFFYALGIQVSRIVVFYSIDQSDLNKLKGSRVKSLKMFHSVGFNLWKLNIGRAKDLYNAIYCVSK